jgi:Methyltransferase FkbM domain
LGTTEVQTVAEGGTSIAFETLDHCLAAYADNNAIGIFKTDTDGYDIKIIKGASAIIDKHHPVIFLEYDRVLFEKNGDEGINFFSFLKDHGYNGAVFYDNYGKLICATKIAEAYTIQSLHSYIKNNKGNFEFFDIMLFAENEEALFQGFVKSELAFFEQ